MNAKVIFGPDIGSLKGKTVRQGSDQVKAGVLIPIPAAIMRQYCKVTLAIDIMNVNWIPFFVTMD